jgi:NTP pyrophosphatase (non-canonical NTP hydrolase)
MKLIDQAIAFRKAFEFPSNFTEQGFQLQQRLIQEESAEVMEACANSECTNHDPASSEELLKELADLVFVCYQMAAYMQWDLDDAMNRVFHSNMTKLGEDGRPIRRDDAKVLKGPNYKPPKLTDIISSKKMRDCHPSTEGRKAQFLDRLYEADGRGEKSHPMHALYTGLYQKYIQGELNVPS